MAGYMLIEQKMLKPYKADGIPPNAQEIGFLDYLRELRQEVFPFARGSRLRIVGFEDALLAADDREAIGAEFHRLLVARANELEQMGSLVQIVFAWPLHFGDELWFERGRERIALRRVFGHVRQEQEGSVVYYLTGFNLT